ncbi:hypothetical protein GCM10019016_108420 [Streptomyces prasinosporus]|uniref:Uncharacterized protein n=1 Tax=Streptomyces prasinosporus TaxID=68256 RepID=A0ABP6U966_9ACTN
MLPGSERTRPVPSTRTPARTTGNGEGVHTPWYDGGSDRPCPEAEPYCGTRGTEPTAPPQPEGVGGSPTAAASPDRREEGREWVTRSSELNSWVTSAPAPGFVMYVPGGPPRP